MRCELVDLSKSPEEIGNYLVKNYLPIFDEFWKVRGAKYYRAERWNPEMAQGLYSLMHAKSMVLALAFDGLTPVGFVMGATIKPIIHNKAMLSIECWYGRSSEVEEALFNYLADGLAFMQVDQIAIPRYSSHAIPKAVSRLMDPMPDIVFEMRGR
jgi:hypothetical protein